MKRRIIYLVILFVIVLIPIGCSRVYTLFVVNYLDSPVFVVVDGVKVGDQLKAKSSVMVPRLYFSSTVDVKVLSLDNRELRASTVGREEVMKDTIRDQIILIEVR